MKLLRIPASRIEADRRLVREVFVFLPRNNRHIRLRQKGQHFEDHILQNYVAKGHTEFFVDAEEIANPDPATIVLFEEGYVGESNIVPFTPGTVASSSPKSTQEGTVIPFERPANGESAEAESKLSDSATSSDNAAVDNASEATASLASAEEPPPERSTETPSEERSANIAAASGSLDEATDAKEDQRDDDVTSDNSPAAESISEPSHTQESPQTQETPTDQIQNANEEVAESTSAGKPTRRRFAFLDDDAEDDASAPAPLENRIREANASRDRTEQERGKKKKYLAEKIEKMRALQEKEKAQREEKRTRAIEEKKKNSERIRAERAAIEEEARLDRDADIALERLNFKNDSSTESETALGGSKANESAQSIKGVDENVDKTENRFSADSPIDQESIRVKGGANEKPPFLSSTLALDDTIGKLKESFIHGKLNGKEDDIVLNLANFDPEVDLLIEGAISANEIGKKMLVMGIQLESLKEREKESNSISAEEQRVNSRYRERILEKLETLSSALEQVRSGGKLDGELRVELNIDFLKEEIVDAIREGSTGLEKVMALADQVDKIKVGLGKTEALIDDKNLVRIVTEASPEEEARVTRLTRALAPSESDDQPDSLKRVIADSDEEARSGYERLLSGDPELRVASDEVARRLSINYLNEISAFTVQLALALGYRRKEFLRDVTMAALIELRSKDVESPKVNNAPVFTQNVLQYLAERTEGPSVVFDAAQIIELVRRVVRQENFTPNGARLDSSILRPALAQARSEPEQFAATFIERSKQFVDRGIRVSDASYSYQISREAIVTLKSTAL